MALCCSAGAGEAWASCPTGAENNAEPGSPCPASRCSAVYGASFPGQFKDPQGLAAGAAINRGVYMSENVPGYK